MQSQKLTVLQKVLQKYNKNYGNILHLCVYTRDHTQYLNLKNTDLESQKHNNNTPIELAKLLNYTEFYTSDERSNTIKSYTLSKYLNPIKGYEKRNIKLTKDHLQSISNKITNIDINNCNIVKVENKILIKHNGKKYKFKGKQGEIDELYELLIDQNKRDMLSDDISYKDYYYVFLSKVLVDIVGDKELCKIVGELLPEYSVENVSDPESSETYYDSCEEQFFDVNEE